MWYRQVIRMATVSPVQVRVALQVLALVAVVVVAVDLRVVRHQVEVRLATFLVEVMVDTDQVLALVVEEDLAVVPLDMVQVAAKVVMVMKDGHMAAQTLMVMGFLVAAEAAVVMVVVVIMVVVSPKR